MERQNDRKITQKRKNDILLLLLLAAVGGVLSLLFWRASPAAGVVDVRVAGRVTASYPLSEDCVVTITGAHGGTNELHIAHGTACLKEATCPDKLCVKRGEISRDGESIICLPNQVVIELRGGAGKEGSLDGVVG